MDTNLGLAIDNLARELLSITGTTFRNKTPSQIKRRALGAELQAVESWPKALAETPHDSLKALAQRFETLIESGQQAVAHYDTAVANNRDFRELKERPAFIAKTNSLRKTTEGQLADIVHSRTELHLPKN